MFVALLVAGLSKRCGDVNKLTKRLNNKPLFWHSLFTLLNLYPVNLITGYKNVDIQQLANSYYNISQQSHKLNTFNFVFNPDFETGMLSSVLTAIRAANGDDVAIFLADMPFVSNTTAKGLIDSFTLLPQEFGAIAVKYQDHFTPPIVIKKEVCSLILSRTWSSSINMRDVLATLNTKIAGFLVNNPAELKDIDYLEDFNKL